MSVAKLQASLRREAKTASKAVQAALEALANAHARRLSGSGVLVRTDAETRALAAALARLGAASDLSGRVDLRFPTAKPVEPEQFAAAGVYGIDVVSGDGRGANLVPKVTFAAAVADLEERDPVGAAELQRAGFEVEDAYGGYRDPMTGETFFPHAFAAARAADVEVATRVKFALVAGLARGKPTDEIVRELVTTWDWPAAYAATVTRTTINTATTAGRMREGQRVAASGILVGYEFKAVMDSDTRPGHAALDGLKMRHDDPLLDDWSPPLGYNCRCILLPLVGSDVPAAWASLPAGAAKERGFGRNPSKVGAYA